MEWCGQAVEPDSLLCFHPREEFQCLSPPGFAVFSLSLRESQLADIAARLGHPGLFDVMRCELAINAAGATHLAELRGLLSRMFALHNAGGARALAGDIGFAAGREDVTDDDFVNLFGRHPGALQCRLDGHRAEVGRGHRA